MFCKTSRRLWHRADLLHQDYHINHGDVLSNFAVADDVIGDGQNLHRLMARGNAVEGSGVYGVPFL